MAIDGHGRILVTGSKYTRGPSDDGAPGPDLYAVVVERYLPDGAPDASFGDGGRVVTRLHRNAEGEALVVQPDGGIVVATSLFGNYDADSTLVVIRYRDDGTRDMDFGIAGTGRTGVAGAGMYAFPRRIRVRGDGLEVFTHDAIVRLHADGTPDSSFGTSGVRLIEPGQRRVDGVRNAGTGYVAWGVSGGVWLLDGDGTRRAEGTAPGVPWSWEAAGAEDGSVFVLGHTADSAEVRVAKLDASGGPVGSFGANGTTATTVAPGSVSVLDSTVLPGGDVLGLGNRFPPDHRGREVFLARYTANGQPAPGFGRDGVALVHFDTTPPEMVMRPDTVPRRGTVGAWT